jgi:Lon protease-like protein
MRSPLLPLFPLSTVLMPGTLLPLHIFEERYKTMVGAAIEGRTEFGIVQAGDKGILNIGCTATVKEVVKKYDDGRMDIVITGHRRFEIIDLDDNEDYLRADVTFFDDDQDAAPPAAELRASAIAGFNALYQALGETGRVYGNDEDPRLSFKMALFVNELPVRQTLLTLRSETDRLRYLNDFFPEYVAKVRRTEHVKRVAPLNGHTRSAEH